jgi:hypothetical protein
MRAAWSRRTDEELLHAFFLEELSATGREVIEQLVIDKVGPLEAYFAPFAREQGDIVTTFPVRGCEVSDANLPVMWGYIVLATNGIAFVAEGVEANEGVSELLRFGLGDIAGMMAASFLDRRHTLAEVRTRAPLPLLASIERSIVWIGRDQIDEVLWGPDFGEVIRGGERVLCAEPRADAEAIVNSWAEARAIPLAALEAAPFTR